jgi:hypothetical protein
MKVKIPTSKGIVEKSAPERDGITEYLQQPYEHTYIQAGRH